MHCDHMQDPEIIITEIDEQLFLFVTEEILITVSWRAPDKEAWPSP